MTVLDDAPREIAATRRSRLEVLDGLRGVAALIVVLFHFFQHYGVEYRNAVFAWTGLELFNGPASVVTFFVLSGFVLTVAVADDPTGAKLVNATLRRWPRLAGPVLIAGLMLGLGALLHVYPSPTNVSPDVIHANGSILDGHNRQAQNIAGVVYEATIGAFLSNAPRYNLVLWTMHFELIGSFVVFAVAAARRIGGRWMRVGTLTVICGGSVFISPWLLPFLFGIALCLVWDRGMLSAWSPSSGVLVLALPLSLLVFATVGPNMTLRLAAGLDRWTIKYAWMIAESAAASVLIVLALRNAPVRRVLTHPVCLALGHWSFAVYLTHLTVLFSVSAWLRIMGTPMPINLVATVALSYAAAAPLAAFDRWWLGRLRTWIDVVRPASREPVRPLGG